MRTADRPMSITALSRSHVYGIYYYIIFGVIIWWYEYVLYYIGNRYKTHLCAIIVVIVSIEADITISILFLPRSYFINFRPKSDQFYFMRFDTITNCCVKVFYIFRNVYYGFPWFISHKRYDIIVCVEKILWRQIL